MRDHFDRVLCIVLMALALFGCGANRPAGANVLDGVPARTESDLDTAIKAVALRSLVEGLRSTPPLEGYWAVVLNPEIARTLRSALADSDSGARPARHGDDWLRAMEVSGVVDAVCALEALDACVEASAMVIIAIGQPVPVSDAAWRLPATIVHYNKSVPSVVRSTASEHSLLIARQDGVPTAVHDSTVFVVN